MKKNWTLRLGVLVAVLTLITASMVSGTFAKYTTEVSGSDTAVVAKWVADFENEGTVITDSATLDLFDTASDTGVTAGTIAPGTTGSFEFDYGTNGSQVARNVTISASASAIATDLPQLKFYITTDSAISTTSAAIALTSLNGELFSQDFEPTDAGDGIVKIIWEWPFNNGNDEDDTADGIAAKSYNVEFIFNASQLDE